MKKKIFALIIGIIILVGGFVAYIFMTPFVSQEIYITYPYEGDTKLWNHYFEIEESHSFHTQPLGAIIPHDVLTADQIALFYSALGDKLNPSTIVVIGPNHFETLPEYNVQTCDFCVFTSPYGELGLASDLIKKLSSDGIATLSNETFIQEHSIFTHAPFIKKVFPDANILPIVLQWEMPVEEVENLSNWLHENLPEDALVIASVDFSHYLPKNISDFHDESSYTSIKNFDLDNIYDLEIDSPSSVYALLSLMKKRGYMRAERYIHTNTQDYINEIRKETTSHQFFVFFEGEIDRVSGVSLLSFGNIKENEDLGFLKGWDWDRNYDPQTDLGIQKQLKNIRGEEDRFLTGSDFLIFDMPENECINEKQNGMQISFCKFTETFLVTPEVEFESVYMSDESNELLKENAALSDIVYVLYEFGGKELTDSRKNALKSLANSGADVVVGRGIENIEPFEVYNDSLIFYSLGNFITDNKLLSELNAQSAGLMVGMYITPSSYDLYFSPVKVENGDPTFLEYAAQIEFLSKYFVDSDFLSYSEMNPRTGILKIER